MTRQRTLRRRESIYERNRRLARRKTYDDIKEFTGALIVGVIGAIGLYCWMLLAYGMGLS